MNTCPSATYPLPYAAAQQKRLTTLVARAALAGVTLHRIEGDFVPELFIVSRWALTREFTRLDDVEKWLDLITGKKAEAA